MRVRAHMFTSGVPAAGGATARGRTGGHPGAAAADPRPSPPRRPRGERRTIQRPSARVHGPLAARLANFTAPIMQSTEQSGTAGMCNMRGVCGPSSGVRTQTLGVHIHVVCLLATKSVLVWRAFYLCLSFYAGRSRLSPRNFLPPPPLSFLCLSKLSLSPFSSLPVTPLPSSRAPKPSIRRLLLQVNGSRRTRRRGRGTRRRRFPPRPRLHPAAGRQTASETTHSSRGTGRASCEDQLER